ncbi:MAG: hypothetical protein ACPL5F_14910, partial [Moorellaceae bacterium]
CPWLVCMAISPLFGGLRLVHLMFMPVPRVKELGAGPEFVLYCVRRPFQAGTPERGDPERR